MAVRFLNALLLHPLCSRYPIPVQYDANTQSCLNPRENFKNVWYGVNEHSATTLKKPSQFVNWLVFAALHQHAVRFTVGKKSTTQIHSPATLLGTSIHLLFHAIIRSVNHVSAKQHHTDTDISEFKGERGMFLVPNHKQFIPKLLNLLKSI